jgi:serine/threonine protein kinase
LTPEVWGRVCQAFDLAVDMDQDQRAEFLSTLQKNDPETAAALAAMLRSQATSKSLPDLPTRLLDKYLTTEVHGGAEPGGAHPAGGAAQDLANGDGLPWIGPYRTIRELARGGMGVVLLAIDEKFARPVAVKVLAAEHACNRELIQRFEEEAQLMARLQHPAIPPVHDRGKLADGRPYLAMKLIKGRTLAELLREADSQRSHAGDAPNSSPGRDPTRLLNIFDHICHTVAYAHSRGVVHRDLKPANVMVGTHGEVQVMDWGLAKVIVASRDDREEAKKVGGDDRLPASTFWAPPHPGPATLAGSIMGTVAYMAPEQARGEVDTLDERCDVFGLGAILCEILTGKPCYATADDRVRIRLARAGDVTDAYARLDASGADRQLVELAKHCLAPRKEDRPRDGSAVAAQVVCHQAELSARLRQAEIAQAAARVQAVEERKRRLANRRWAAIGAVFLLLAGAGALWFYAERDEMRQASRRALLRSEFDGTLKEERRRAEALEAQLADYKKAQDLISDPAQWESQLDKRREILLRAEKMLAGAPESGEFLSSLQERRSRLDTDQEHFALARALDDIHLESFLLVEEKVNPSDTAPRYARFFNERLKMDVAKDDPSQLAKLIKESPLRHVLVAALDHWAEECAHAGGKGRSLLSRLLRLAAAADSDSWRDKFRQITAWQDRRILEGLAAELKPMEQSPQILSALGGQLQRLEGNGVSVLGEGLVHYPGNFWLNLTMAHVLQSSVERAGYYQAALASRPKSSVVWNHLGAALFLQRKFPEALGVYQKAAQFSPKDWNLQRQIGKIYLWRGRFAEADGVTRQALTLLSADHPAHDDVLAQARLCAHCLDVLGKEKLGPVGAAGKDVMKGTLAAGDPIDFYWTLFSNSKDDSKRSRKAHLVKLWSAKNYLIDLESTDFDPILRVETEAGNPVVNNDDINPNNRNSRLVFTPEQDAIYKLVVNSFDPRKYGAYSLNVRETVAAETPVSLTGELGKTSKRDKEGKYLAEHGVVLKKKTAYVLELKSQRFDTYLRLLDEQGNTLAFNDDIAPGDFRCSRIDFTPQVTGTYILVATSYWAREIGPYKLSIQGFQLP